MSDFEEVEIIKGNRPAFCGGCLLRSYGVSEGRGITTDELETTIARRP